MRFNIKKISAVLTSVAMVGASIGVAAAASYPAPFVSGGAASAAVVYGTGAGVSYLDVAEAGNIQSDLQSRMTGTSGTSSASTTGEVAELFTGSTKIYINDTIRSVRSVLTKSEMPITLADTSFSGNVDATITQTITLGNDPIVSYRKGPTSENDPEIGLALSTTSGQIVYNATATFSQAINASHADSQGETIELFGTSYTISSSTTGTSLVLLQSAEKITLTNDANPSQETTIGGETYIVELVSASDTAATIQVTDSAGNTESKEVSEAQSKKISGVQVAVINADENNFRLSASIVVGSEKITLANGQEITYGEDNTAIDGTTVELTSGGRTDALSKIVVGVRAPTSDEDYIKPGTEFVDPVFKTFKVDFSGVNIDETSTSRETIKIQNTGDDKASITMTDWRGNEKTVQFANNASIPMNLQWDSESNNITVVEGEKVYKNGYVVVGNKDEGYLLKVSTITNSTTAYSSDAVKFTDVFSGDTYSVVITQDGEGTVSVGGKIYNVIYGGASTVADTSRWVSLEYSDSTTAGNAVIYPTIQTSKGAKVALYEPVSITLDDFDQKGTSITGLKFPNGDTYTDVTITEDPAQTEVWNVTASSSTTVFNTTLADAISKAFAIGTLYFNITAVSEDVAKVYLQNPSTRLNIADPAIIIWEEKDDNSRYEALVVTMDSYTSSSDKIGVDEVYRTWMTSTSTGDTTYRQTLYTDSDITKQIDLYGSIVTLDANTADQKFAEISYPDEQVYAQIYVAAADASITPGTTTGTTVTQLGDIKVKDTEVTSVSTKNLIVVGGSCINSVAANLLGGAYCEASFTEQTGVGSGQYVIQSFADKITTGKIALLVAGYDAQDTVNAATYLRTKTVDTTAGVKYIGTSATSAEKQ